MFFMMFMMLFKQFSNMKKNCYFVFQVGGGVEAGGYSWKGDSKKFLRGGAAPQELNWFLEGVGTSKETMVPVLILFLSLT